MMDDDRSRQRKPFRFTLIQLVSVFVFTTLLIGIAVIQFQNRRQLMNMAVENVRLRHEVRQINDLLEESKRQQSRLSLAENLLLTLIQQPSQHSEVIEFLNSQPVGNIECMTHPLVGIENRSFCKYYQSIQNLDDWWSGKSACFIVQDEPFRIIDILLEGHARSPEKKGDQWIIRVVRGDAEETSYGIDEFGFQPVD